MNRRNVLELAAVLLAATLLAACGRKGPLLQPEDVDPDDNSEYEMWPEDAGSDDALWPEDANPNPDDDSNDAPWPMEVDPDINSESEP
jgi:predicted small lipoprotein YifL